MTDNVIVYGKPQCSQCEQTKRYFEKQSIQIDYVDVTKDAEAMAKVKELGYLQAPVVYVSDTVHWSGHLPHKIDEHLA